MKFIAVCDEEMLVNFGRDYSGLTLLLKDADGYTRAVELKPIIRPLIVNDDGRSAYLSPEHINCLLDFEREEVIKKIAELKVELDVLEAI